MTILEIAILAVVQGVTEYLPVSSWGHLIVLQRVGNFSDQGLLIEVAVHIGSLAAVLLYFWRDVWSIPVGLVHALQGRRSPGARLVLNLLVATVPVILAGFLLKDFVEGRLRTVEVVAWATFLGAFVLWIGDRFGMTIRRVEHMGLGTALAIGLLQVSALVPGVSRSGSTMMAARFLGFKRSEAARFSFLLSIPVILGAGTLLGFDLYQQGSMRLTAEAGIAAIFSFLAAFACIAFMMRWLRTAKFTIFVVYRLLVGGALLWLVYARPELVGLAG